MKCMMKYSLLARASCGDISGMFVWCEEQLYKYFAIWETV